MAPLAIVTGAGTGVGKATALAMLRDGFAKEVLQANGEVAVESLMDVEHVAQCVLATAKLPLNVNVLFQTVVATRMPFVGRG